MKVLVPILVLFGWAGLGAALRTSWIGRTSSEWPTSDFVVDGLAGAVVLHLYLNLLALLGIRWNFALLIVPMGIGSALLLAPLVSRPVRIFAWVRSLGWGDLVAVLAVLVVAGFAVKLSIVSSDFIYHWGAKGQRFYVARTIDYEYLSRPWNWPINPNYPTLLPEIYATTAVITGRFLMPAAMVWTAVWFGLLLVAARSLLRRPEDSHVQQMALGTLATVLGTLIISMRLGGGADLLIALALLAALPLYPQRDTKLADWAIGICAAFAAASKLEGIVLGGLLVSARVGWHIYKHSLDWRATSRISLLPLIVVTHWGAECLRYGLKSAHAFSFHELDIGHASTVVTALWQSLGAERTYGLCFLVLLFPILLWAQRTRFAGFVILAQFSIYTAFYFGVPNPARYSLASFPRLVLHLLPAVIAGLTLLIPHPNSASSTLPEPKAPTAPEIRKSL